MTARRRAQAGYCPVDAPSARGRTDHHDDDRTPVVTDRKDFPWPVDS